MLPIDQIHLELKNISKAVLRKVNNNKVKTQILSSLDMKVQKGGKIVNISSMAARIGDLLTSPHYSAAKAGVLGLMRHVAKEMGPYGINVNSIAQGLSVSGPQVKGLAGGQETGKADAIYGNPWEDQECPEEWLVVVFMF
jgi:NAD(P)-dependent dehydrogenase (short-subunit alcohol dehydrogenase family)